MNVEEVIFICGVQYVCKGNEATGDMLFEIEPGNQISVPICKQCMDALVALDSDHNGLVD